MVLVYTGRITATNCFKFMQVPNCIAILSTTWPISFNVDIRYSLRDQPCKWPETLLNHHPQSPPRHRLFSIFFPAPHHALCYPFIADEKRIISRERDWYATELVPLFHDSLNENQNDASIDAEHSHFQYYLFPTLVEANNFSWKKRQVIRVFNIVEQYNQLGRIVR